MCYFTQFVINSIPQSIITFKSIVLLIGCNQKNFVSFFQMIVVMMIVIVMVECLMMMMMTMLAGPRPSIILLTISSQPGSARRLGNSPQISSHSAHQVFDGRRAPWGRYPDRARRTHARYTRPGSSQLNLRHIHVPTFDPMAVVLENILVRVMKMLTPIGQAVLIIIMLQ